MPGEEDNKQIGAGAGAGPVTVNGYTIDPGNAGFPALVQAAGGMTGIDLTSPNACGPVKAFQNAWNAAGGTPALTVDGGYGTDTASANAAMSQANGDTGNVPAGLTGNFPNCGGTPTPPTPPPQPPVPSGGMKTWVKVLLWLLVGGGVVGLGVLIYRWMNKKGGASESRKRRRGKGRRKGRRRKK